MSKQTKEYNHAYQNGFYAGKAETAAKMEQNGDDIGAFALAEMDCILQQQEGYVRIGVGTDGAPWVRYKWTKGTHADCYTFGSGETLSMAIAQVCGRVHEINAGKRKPTRDTGYKRR